MKRKENKSYQAIRPKFIPLDCCLVINEKIPVIVILEKKRKAIRPRPTLGYLHNTIKHLNYRQNACFHFLKHFSVDNINQYLYKNHKIKGANK